MQLWVEINSTQRNNIAMFNEVPPWQTKHQEVKTSNQKDNVTYNQNWISKADNEHTENKREKNTLTQKQWRKRKRREEKKWRRWRKLLYSRTFFVLYKLIKVIWILPSIFLYSFRFQSEYKLFESRPSTKTNSVSSYIQLLRSNSSCMLKVTKHQNCRNHSHLSLHLIAKQACDFSMTQALQMR